MNIKVKALHPLAHLPERKKPGDAGADLYCIEGLYLHAHESRPVRTGIAVEIPDGYYGKITSRSGLAKTGIGVDTGTIDSGYRGEVMVLLNNRTHETKNIERGTRIAQLIVIPIDCADFGWSDDLSSTERADGGFGSTGER